jgi:hypothetical protein
MGCGFRIKLNKGVMTMKTKIGTGYRGIPAGGTRDLWQDVTEYKLATGRWPAVTAKQAKRLAKDNLPHGPIVPDPMGDYAAFKTALKTGADYEQEG